MNPDEAAALMTNPDGSVDMGDGSTMDGLEGDTGDENPGVGGSKTVMQRLFATEPNTPLEKIESPWQPEVGGPSRVYRGIQKIGDIEGMPAIMDLVIGAVETAVGMEEEETVDADYETETETEPESEDTELVSLE